MSGSRVQDSGQGLFGGSAWVQGAKVFAAEVLGAAKSNSAAKPGHTSMPRPV